MRPMLKAIVMWNDIFERSSVKVYADSCHHRTKWIANITPSWKGVMYGIRWPQAKKEVEKFFRDAGLNFTSHRRNSAWHFTIHCSEEEFLKRIRPLVQNSVIERSAV